jgi:glycosyltransferase involved in cell wall biosynthesis
LKTIDASIVLNLHREGIYLKRTLLSLDEAVRSASSEGFSIELICVLDRPDELTEEVMRAHDTSAYADVSILKVDNGSLGLSRNDGIEVASGEYILTADGDDLVSENFIRETLESAIHGNSKCLYVPEFLFGFGTTYYIYVLRPLDAVTPFSLFDIHPFISRLCAPRSIFEKLRFNDLRLSRGYAYEDWHFICEVVAAGYDIKVVPDVILFYRQRSDSLLQLANTLSTRQIPPTQLFKPFVYLDVCKKYLNIATRPLDMRQMTVESAQAILSRPNITRWLQRANTIDPSISLQRFQCTLPFNNMPSSLASGIAYYRLCDLLEGLKFDDVFLFPFVSRGGAEKFFLEILSSLHHQFPEREILMILGEDFCLPSWSSKLPSNVTLIDLGELHAELSMEAKVLLTLKLLQSACEDATIHIRHSVFGDTFLRSFGHVLTSNPIIFYRFNDDERAENGAVTVRHTPRELIADRLEHLAYVVTDNTAVAELDVHLLGVSPSKWQVLRAPIAIPQLPPREDNAYSRALWASRLDGQKRPELVAKIAAKLKEKRSTVVINAFGSSVFGEYSEVVFTGHENLNYGGPYDGFDALPIEQHGIFIYTSWSDGIPNVLLEAMAAGLTVIAPDVGGISEIVKDGDTGILLPSLADDDEMAEHYADAIVKLSSDPTLARRLSANAIELLRRQHSHEVYDQRVAELFGRGGVHG